jgi:hypothetical protein
MRQSLLAQSHSSVNQTPNRHPTVSTQGTQKNSDKTSQICIQALWATKACKLFGSERYTQTALPPRLPKTPVSRHIHTRCIHARSQPTCPQASSVPAEQHRHPTATQLQPAAATAATASCAPRTHPTA